ncbi:uncharacterized protein Dwil_GK19342 [Drosophila willistoni]|uniref:Uncharacterized protein n=1 Tax=Drosophila willistoni TaxID=7260 RepID=B4MNS1_DROWI|nr:drosocin [Drosophila willistoni]EDW73760.1 uncharacterized protein Dwil_GK19342 [Drosophila willistoni]
MKFSIIFAVFLAICCALAVATPGKPRPYSPRPTSHPRPIRVRRDINLPLEQGQQIN